MNPCLVVIVVFVGAAHDARDLHALPLQVDGLRGLLVPIANYFKCGLAELGLDLLEGLPAVGWHCVENGRGKGRGVGVNPEGLGRGARGERQEGENLHGFPYPSLESRNRLSMKSGFNLLLSGLESVQCSPLVHQSTFVRRKSALQGS